MIHNVYLFDEDGLPLAAIKIGSIDADSALLSGFLSTVQSFSKKISQGDVDKIKTGDYTFHIRKVRSVYVALVADRAGRDTRMRLDLVSEIIEKRKDRYDDQLTRIKIRDAVTKKESMADRAKSWGKAVL